MTLFVATRYAQWIILNNYFFMCVCYIHALLRDTAGFLPLPNALYAILVTTVLTMPLCSTDYSGWQNDHYILILSNTCIYKVCIISLHWPIHILCVLTCRHNYKQTLFGRCIVVLLPIMATRRKVCMQVITGYMQALTNLYVYIAKDSSYVNAHCLLHC